MQEKPTHMKKITNNRTIVIICLVVLIYCLSILIEKRITPNTGFDFKLWPPYYLVFAVVIPLVILLPIKFLPVSGYTNFILQREKILNKIIVISTGIILIWLLLWHAMSAIGDLMGKSLNTTEAETASLTSIKNDSIIKTKIGLVDSIELVSNSISSKVATYDYILHGKDSTINVEISLGREQKWIVDTIIIK
jgi:hypothetical protein